MNVEELLQEILNQKNESGRIVLNEDIIHKIAQLNETEYEKLKLHLYSHVLLNGLKFIDENKLDKLVGMYIKQRIEKFDLESIPALPGFFYPRGYTEVNNTLFFADIQKVCRPIVYIVGKKYVPAEEKSYYILKTAHTSPREIEVEVTKNLEKAVKNAGVNIYDKNLFTRYLSEYLKTNEDILAKNEIIETTDNFITKLVEAIRRGTIKPHLTITRLSKENAVKCFAFWPLDIEKIMKQCKIKSYRKFLKLLAQEDKIITSDKSNERVVRVEKNKVERMIVFPDDVINEKLPSSSDDGKIVELIS